MNDRFKFRIYDLEQKHYLRVIQDETTGAEGFAAFYGEYNNICKPMSFFLCHNIDRWVIEQCTGLKDNCGNLIYEGDIIGDGEDDYIIKWDSNRTMFVAEDIDTSYEIEDVLDPTICVIGNVHNQPEQKD